MTLTVLGASGQQVVLNSSDIAILESSIADGGFKSSGGYIAAVGTYTGIPILTSLQFSGRHHQHSDTHGYRLRWVLNGLHL